MGTAMTTGEKIRAKRLDLKLSQDDLAIQSGINQATISDIENSNTKFGRSDTIAALAKALGVSTDYLLRDEAPEET